MPTIPQEQAPAQAKCNTPLLSTDYLLFLSEQITFHIKRAEVYEGGRKKLHLDTADKFKALSEELSRLYALYAAAVDSRSEAKSSVSGNQLSLSLEDIEGLPVELVEELSISSTDLTEFAITSLIDEAGGILSLDKILVGLYKETGEIHRRQNMTNRLYRMVAKNMIYSVPNKKGAYATHKLTSEEAETILNPKQ
jgi:hypothetical protein